MYVSKTNKILNILIAAVWLLNGLFCKVLNFVPRHKDIVSKILQLDKYAASIFTIAIGFSEILMAIWILSRYKHRLNAIVQIFIIAIMNFLEFLIAPDLLLWGKLNSLFAFIFILIIYVNEFSINDKQKNA